MDLDQVLLVSQGDRVTVGQPTIPGAKVKTEVVAHGRGAKIVVFRYHAKTRYRRRTGHRQPYTELDIKEIVAGSSEAAALGEAPPETTAEGPDNGT